MSAKELGTAAVPAARPAFCPNPCATETLAHCKMDASSKPAKRDDSAILAIVLAPNRLPLIDCVNRWNDYAPPSGLLISPRAIHRLANRSCDLYGIEYRRRT